MPLSLRFVLLALVIAALSVVQPAAAAEILWRVENPFRLFTDPAISDVHRDIYDQLSEAEKLEPIVSAERRLMERYPAGWARGAFASTCWKDRKSVV